MDIRLSGSALKVIRLLLEQPNRGLSGAEISKLASIGSGTLYPLVARLEKAGWVVGNWEGGDPALLGRPRRRFYTLTAVGYRLGRAALAELQVPVGVLSWNT
jgi:PadR family transcriptional regulator PadR